MPVRKTKHTPPRSSNGAGDQGLCTLRRVQRCDAAGGAALSNRGALKAHAARGRMRNAFAMAAFTILGGLGQPHAVQAQDLDEQWRWCTQENAPDLSIGACTAVIRSGLISRENLVLAFKNRGDAYMRKGDCERAIEDYDQAIRLNPNFLPAVASRGICHAATGRRDAAMRDYDQAIH